jgi:hypothetical protein
MFVKTTNSEYIDSFKKILSIINYAKSSINNYVKQIEQFWGYLGINAKEIKIAVLDKPVFETSTAMMP